jgi:hypothetical protein
VNRYTSTFHTIVECRGNTTPCDSEACLQASGKPSKRASDVTSPPPLTKTKVYLTGLALHVLTRPIGSLFSISSIFVIDLFAHLYRRPPGEGSNKFTWKYCGIKEVEFLSFDGLLFSILILILRKTKGSCTTYSYHYRDSSLIVE